MSQSTGTAAPAGAPRRSGPWKIATAAMIGTSVEWYDFGIYATAAALVFPELFFPEMSRALGTLMSFATLFVGALGRPLGAILFGHIGDRHGRKKALIWSMTLMGAATVCIGLLPTYSQIGVLAPLLLVLIRMIQSLAVGGEWGGAVLFAVEHAPPRRKAFFGSFPQVGDGVGYFLSTGVFALTALVGHDALAHWAWRLPFLLSAVLVAVGLVIRRSMDESPEFEAARRAEEASGQAGRGKESAPVIAVLRHAWKTWLLATGAFLITVGGYYIVVTFMSSYAVTELGFTDAQAAAAGTAASVVVIVCTPLSALFADRYGLRRVTLIGVLLHLVAAFPMFWLADTRSVAGLWLAMCLPMLASTIAYASLGTLASGWFAPRVRYTGLSMSFQTAGLLGTLAPAATTWLYSSFGGSWVPVAVAFAAMAAVSAVCLLACRPAPEAGTSPDASKVGAAALAPTAAAGMDAFPGGSDGAADVTRTG
ncbi:MFS transporter [Streptomyces sp. TLI_105]|uniref:MFS transporter n=1 Tax=Streptomyces sp. TLI_105 TaxID=1881019 RepID=UPI00089B0BA8|nr:MFS transporter [Streptomyces sp. TLI_105]SEE05281.1 Major Facilitator Superfamily protein [Streptomyces sp. TLI_105]